MNLFGSCTMIFLPLFSWLTFYLNGNFALVCIEWPFRGTGQLLGCLSLKHLWIWHGITSSWQFSIFLVFTSNISAYCHLAEQDGRNYLPWGKSCTLNCKIFRFGRWWIVNYYTSSTTGWHHETGHWTSFFWEVIGQTMSRNRSKSILWCHPAKCYY